MASSSALPPRGTFRVRVGERTFDLAFQEGRLLVNDHALPVHVETLGPGRYALLLNGTCRTAFVQTLPDGQLRVTMGSRSADVRVKSERALLLEQYGLSDTSSSAEREVRAPMPGLVLRLLVAPGQAVEAGQGLMVLEAMKMENELKAAGKGVVKAVYAEPGTAVGKNELLLEFEPEGA